MNPISSSSQRRSAPGIFCLFIMLPLLVLSSDNLPCYLQNGCVCNHSTPTYNVQNHQTYGTCDECATGWTGAFCDQHDVKCFNGGQKLPSGQCQCDDAWSGPACIEHQCLHSKGGKGPNSVAPPSNRNMCEGCNTDWAGVNCAMCQTDKVCPKDHICNTSIVATGDKKQLQCDVTETMFLKLLGRNRAGVGGTVTLDCDKPGGFGDPTANGQCQIGFYRIEPGKSYLDPFFFCTTFGCKMEVSRQLEDDGKPKGESSSTRGFRVAMSAILYLELVILAVLSFLNNKSRAWAFKRLVAVVGLTIFVLVVGMGISLSHRTQAKVTETVVYTCESATCRCAEDPPSQYNPKCAGSPFGEHILPTIKGQTSFECDVQTNNCTFKPHDVPIHVGLSCQGAECVAPEFTPPDVKNNFGPMNSTAIIVSVTFIIITAAILLLRHRSMQNTHHAVMEFKRRFFNDAIRQFEATVGGHHSGSGDKKRRSPRIDSHGDELDGVIGEGHGVMPSHSINNESSSDVVDDLEEGDVLLFDNREEGRSVAAGTGASAEDLEDPSSPLSRTQDTLAQHFTLDADSLGYSVQDRSRGDHKQVLENISFRLESGEAIALMGPSGAGKTTLLDILAGRNKSGVLTGQLVLGSEPITKDRSDEYRNLLGYVAQEDVAIPSLTVKQSLLYAARLKLPAAFSAKFINQVVDDLIDSLRLRSCAHTLVGDGMSIRGVSGGEKRRLAIGTELVGNPRILYLDEPTSGLDSSSARHVMEAIIAIAKCPPLKKYSDFFRFSPIVVFSIHQPSPAIFTLFDKLILLSRGHLLYYGSANTAVHKIATICGHDESRDPSNPAEALLSIEEEITAAERQRLIDAALQEYTIAKAGSINATPATVAASHEERRPMPSDCTIGNDLLVASTAFKRFYPNAWQQFGVLLKRSAATLMGSYYLIAAHAVVTFAVAGLLGLLYPSEGLDLPGALNRAGALTFLLLVVALVSMSCLELFMAERKLFVVERENGYYRTFPYFCAKLLTDLLPLRIMPVLAMCSLIYFPMGLRVDGGQYFVWYLFILVLFSVCVTLMVLCIGMVSPSFGAGALLSSVAILWNFVFCGLMVQSKTMPTLFEPFQILSPFYLAFESLIVNELDGQTCTFAPSDAAGRPSKDQIPLLCVQYVFNLGLDPKNFDRNICLLLLYCAVLLGIAQLLLSFIKLRR